jgi:hypothetical protein
MSQIQSVFKLFNNAEINVDNLCLCIKFPVSNCSRFSYEGFNLVDANNNLYSINNIEINAKKNR